MAKSDTSQIAVSTAASICVAISFFLWLFIISGFSSARLAVLKQKPIIFAQAVLGILILTGLLISIALSIYQPGFRGGEDLCGNLLDGLTNHHYITDHSRPVLTIEMGFLLLLPTINEVRSLCMLDVQVTDIC